MVDGHVEVEAGVAAVNGIDEFLELVEGGGGAVELGEGGVDCHEVEGGEGAAVAAHAGVGGGGGVDG